MSLTLGGPGGTVGLSINTPIDKVVYLIGRRLCAEEDHEFKVEKWIKVLRDNWVHTVGTLTRLPPGTLVNLGLPVALVVELERISRLQNEWKELEFFHIVKDDSIKSTQYTVKLSPGQKESVNTSFRALFKVNSSGRTGLSQFETDFYPVFFKRNPAGTRLFDMSEMATQSKAFVRMLYWIVENMDNQDLGPVLSQLGGRHLIYGVQEDEYQLFAHAVCDMFKQILGKQFTELMAKAWFDTLMALAGLMKQAGEVTASGFHGQLKKERDNGSWQLVYVSLHLDTLYVFKDKQRKTLSGQYPIRGVLQIQFPKGSVPNAFQLNSYDPPFELNLAALDEEQFSAWISEFDWRIQAIQRVFKAASETESSNSADDSERVSVSTNEFAGLDPEIALKAKETKKKIQKKQKKLQAKMDRKDTSGEEMAQALKVGLELTEEEKATVKLSWKCLIEKRFTDGNGIAKSGIGKLFEDFYAKLFEVNPAGRRLFESTGLKAQGRALVSMIGMIVRCLDDFGAFAAQIKELGGRHKIYGVVESDYVVFSDVLSHTISSLLSDETKFAAGSVKAAWIKVISSLSKMMVAASQMASNEPYVAVLQRKVTIKGSWKKSAISVQLDAIYIYTTEKIQKLRTSIMLNTVTSIDLQPSEGDLPSAFGVVVAYGDETATFAFITKEEAMQFMNELNWRVQAVLRVFKYDDDVTSEDGGRSNRANKFSLAKKRARKDRKK
eukprot:TRINITY_DN15448_c0_g1_i1.p1 TRINITY_DN15448_c0_g1~~TRINITY_DN15448_c0_g1_i1.p1  ORF type:complete len:722 (+),score=192.81 TRINITY_DN15448_c0_g1_i1:32-2197(+)